VQHRRDGPLGEAELQDCERNGFPGFENLFAKNELKPYLDDIGQRCLIQQSRSDDKPGFKARVFYSHADFEAWHGEDSIVAPTGPTGKVTCFECNVIHDSNADITAFARSNSFIVFNSVHNPLVEPFCGLNAQPHFIANRRDYRPLEANE